MVRVRKISHSFLAPSISLDQGDIFACRPLVSLNAPKNSTEAEKEVELAKKRRSKNVLAQMTDVVVFSNRPDSNGDDDDGPDTYEYSIVTNFDIVNNSDTATLIFKIRTTAPEKFQVIPTFGIVNPADTAEVFLKVTPGTLLHTLCYEKFQVQVLRLPDKRKELLELELGDFRSFDKSFYKVGLSDKLSRIWQDLCRLLGKSTIELYEIHCRIETQLVRPSEYRFGPRAQVAPFGRKTTFHQESFGSGGSRESRASGENQDSLTKETKVSYANSDVPSNIAQESPQENPPLSAKRKSAKAKGKVSYSNEIRQPSTSTDINEKPLTRTPKTVLKAIEKLEAWVMLMENKWTNRKIWTQRVLGISAVVVTLYASINLFWAPSQQECLNSVRSQDVAQSAVHEYVM